MRHDLHLWKGCQFYDYTHFGTLAFRYQACLLPAGALYKNLGLAYGAMKLPGHCFKTGKDWQKCADAAMEHYFGDTTPDDDHFKKKQLAVSDHAEKNMKRLQDDENRTKESRAAAVKEFMTACYNVEVLSKKSQIVHNWIHDVFKAHIIQAWTAYEVLAQDLHSRVIRQRKSLKSRSGWPQATKKQPIPTSFTARSGIANVYRFTFAKDNADILDVVDNPAIHALGIMRNLMVHSGGRIDPAFLSHRKGFFVYPSLVQASIPQLDVIKQRRLKYQVPLTGPMVRHFVDPVIPLAFKLVKSVDEWLTRNR